MQTWTIVDSDTLRLMEIPLKKVEEKWCKGSVGLCVSGLPSEKVYFTESAKLGSNHTVKFFKGTCGTTSVFGPERSTPGFIERVNFMGAIRVLQDLRRRQDNTLQQESLAWRVTWDLDKVSPKH